MSFIGDEKRCYNLESADSQDSCLFSASDTNFFLFCDFMSKVAESIYVFLTRIFTNGIEIEIASYQ